jgi:hypothetical protein
MSKKKFFTQVRQARHPTALRFTDATHNDYVLCVGASKGPMEGLLYLQHVTCHSPPPVLDRQGAAELAQVLLRYSTSGVLVPKRTRPSYETCPRCGKKSLDPRATWKADNGQARYHGPKCSNKSCGYRQGMYISHPTSLKRRTAS